MERVQPVFSLLSPARWGIRGAQKVQCFDTKRVRVKCADLEPTRIHSRISTFRDPRIVSWQPAISCYNLLYTCFVSQSLNNANKHFAHTIIYDYVAPMCPCPPINTHTMASGESVKWKWYKGKTINCHFTVYYIANIHLIFLFNFDIWWSRDCGKDAGPGACWPG